MKILDSTPSFETRCPYCRHLLEIETRDISETNGTYGAICEGCKLEFIIPTSAIPIGIKDAIGNRFDPY